jgi:hypothetical protein
MFSQNNNTVNKVSENNSEQKVGKCFIYINWLIEYLLIYVRLKNISLIWRRRHYRWRAAKFRPMFGAQCAWAGRNLYRATPAVTGGLGFSGLIRRTALFGRLLRHTRGFEESILTRILTGLFYTETAVQWPKSL